MQAQRNVSGPIRQQEQQVSWHFIVHTKCDHDLCRCDPTWMLLQVDYFFLIVYFLSKQDPHVTSTNA